MFKTRFISMLVLLAAVATGAWAQTEALLTTITATAKEQASYSTANVATASFSYTAGGSSAYLANWGWWGYGWSATVTAAEGYTITKCIFYDDANRTATDSEAPFVVETTEEDKTPRINGTPIDGGNMWSKGIKKIEVYGYATPATTGYSVTLKDDTEDAANWQGKAGEGEYQSLPLTGLEAGTAVNVKYNGTKKVKSVKARKKAAALSLTSPSVGQVIGSDGKNYAAASVPSGVTKVAMIAYVSGSNGLAIALADEGSLNWATAKSTCEAKTPAFTNGTWHLPSQAEWNNMFSANGGDEESYYGLNAAINNAGGTILQSGSYWSSSEYSPGVGAYFVHLDDGYVDWSKSNETLGRKVRACLAF